MVVEDLLMNATDVNAYVASLSADYAISFFSLILLSVSFMLLSLYLAFRVRTAELDHEQLKMRVARYQRIMSETFKSLEETTKKTPFFGSVLKQINQQTRWLDE